MPGMVPAVGAEARVREVEVKFRLHDVAALVVSLAARGVELGPPVRQDDQAHAPVGWDYGDPRGGVPFARLRTVEGRHAFTVKRPAENVLSCGEHETPVADRDGMHRVVLAMGFRATVRIGKVRRCAVVGEGQMLVCVDQVDGLGAFVEVERLVPDGVPGEVVQACVSLPRPRPPRGPDRRRVRTAWRALRRRPGRIRVARRVPVRPGSWSGQSGRKARWRGARARIRSWRWRR